MDQEKLLDALKIEMKKYLEELVQQEMIRRFGEQEISKKSPAIIEQRSWLRASDWEIFTSISFPSRDFELLQRKLCIAKGSIEESSLPGRSSQIARDTLIRDFGNALRQHQPPFCLEKVIDGDRAFYLLYKVVPS